ncbi:MAG: MiaB/RimO family radical SAM methylthiotransferase [Gemmatimonadota bacterium]|nr:MiaB/RimO family radical SAM methylthiotransferase [Gemmatimonadota bacterium]
MRVYLHTFGCKANQYDTELLRGALEAAGATIVDRAPVADAAIINTCTVTHVSEGKMRGFVRRVARQNPGIRTVVIGCSAALDTGTLAKLPNVVGVVGGVAPGDVLARLGLPSGYESDGLRTFGRGSRAWVRIQDGCDEHCTFCATTLARGDHRSRRPESIVAEARRLAAQHREIVLTGIHIGSYGRDLAGEGGLGTLVAQLIDAVPSARFRLSSVEATEVDDTLVHLLRTAPERLAPHLHAPLQSGSDRVLRRMGRHWYTARTYRERIERIAAGLPAFGLGADVMVGFPGETAADFAETRRILEDLPFTYLHVFPYSERPDTPARRLGAPVAPPVVAARSAELRSLGESKGQAYRAGRAGTPADVVTLGRSRGRCEGLTEDYLTVSWSTGKPHATRFRAQLALESNGHLEATPIEDAA